MAVTENALISLLSGESLAPERSYLITSIDQQPARIAAEYNDLRQHTFVDTQQLFDRTDRDDADADPATTVLVAVDIHGELLGGVRLAPATFPDLGWWRGSRLVLTPRTRGIGVGRALIRAACAWAESNGVLRFEATIQERYEPLFTDLGWTPVDSTEIHGAPHIRMRWPIDRFDRLARATKSLLGGILEPLARQRDGLGPARFRGDDGVPVGSGMVAACDAIVPSMVARDPEWAGWCAALVNVNDLAAMGATPVGMLDAVGAPTTSHLARIIRGLSSAAHAWGVPVLGGHTQVGVPAALSVTALGRTENPVPGGGARPGDALTLTADLSGDWRPGYRGLQWDSTSHRSPAELRHLTGLVAATAPHAAKDVSMAGVVGTVGMMAEAGRLRAEIAIDEVPRPAGVALGDWLTCFPGFAMTTADGPGRPVAHPTPATSNPCGLFAARTETDPLVTIRWPDGEVTTAITGTVTGLAPVEQENS